MLISRKELSFFLVLFLILSETDTAVSGERSVQATSSRIDAFTGKYIFNIVLNSLKSEVPKADTTVEEDQSFKLNFNSKAFYVVSARSSVDGLYSSTSTCWLYILDSSRVIDKISAVGPDVDGRFWACDSTEALSFQDRYADGSLKIIGLYNATAPSNAHFIVPVVLRFDHTKPSLGVDQRLTDMFKDKAIETIKAARALINKSDKGRHRVERSKSR